MQPIYHHPDDVAVGQHGQNAVRDEGSQSPPLKKNESVWGWSSPPYERPSVLCRGAGIISISLCIAK